MSDIMHTVKHMLTRPGQAGIVVFVCVMLAWIMFTPSAMADIKKTDIIAGDTVEASGIASSSCPSIDATHAIVIDDDGNVYFERDADTQVHIASITKVMTAVTAIDSVPLDTTITVTSEAASIGESSAQLQEGDVLTLREALKAMLWPSGNDAALAIAQSVGALMLQSEGADSSDPDACEAAFVEAMNRESQQIGLTNSTWNNPHGLDDGSYAGDFGSTARDVAILAKYALSKSAIRDITSVDGGTAEVQRDGSTVEIVLESTDELLGSYDGVIGLKTGFTDSAGECFAGAVEKDGVTLYSVVLDSSSSSQRFEDTTTLWDWVFDNLVDYSLAQTTEMTTDASGNAVPLVAQVADTAWTDKTVDATLADPQASITVFSLAGNVSQEVSFQEPDGAVSAGDVVGKITFYQHNQVVAEQDLVSTESLEAPNPIQSIGIAWSRFIGGFSGDDGVADNVLYNDTPMINDKSARAAA